MQNPLKDKDAAVVAGIVNVLKTLKHELTEELHKGQRIAHLKERPQVSVRRGRKSKRQGYNDKMDESMGKGKPMKASRKDRRDESKGMEKSMGNRAYSRVQTMDAETFEAPASEENMVDEGSVDAFYGGGRKVAVSSDGITPTTNPSVDEAFNVGNDVGLDVAEQEVMNVNPSVEVNYGADGIGETDVVSTVQDLTSKLGFRVNGLVASALVIGIASMAGYRYAKR